MERKHERKRLRGIQGQIHRWTGAVLAAEIVDFSQTGLGLISMVPLKHGEHVAIHFEVTGQKLRASCSVAWVKVTLEEGCKIGCKMLKLERTESPQPAKSPTEAQHLEFVERQIATFLRTGKSAAMTRV